MGLIPAGKHAEFDRVIGYYEPYATSHDALDREKALLEEVEQAAIAMSEAVQRMRAGELEPPGKALTPPRPK
jgi:hypothetical protein